VRSLARCGVLPAIVAVALGVAASAAVAFYASVELEGAPREDVRVYADAVAGRAGAPDAVTSADVAAAGTGTPGEAVLQWWQLMQAGAAPARVASLLVPAAGRDRALLERQLETLRYVFQQSEPRLVDSQVDGDRARLVTVIASGGARPAPEAHALEIFELARIDGRWRVGRGFLHRRYRAEIAYAAAQERDG
jgi:hypothetical protein